MRPQSKVLSPGATRAASRLVVGAGLLLLLAAPLQAARRPAPALFTIKYPGKTWSLVVDLRGFDLQRPVKKPDGTAVSVRGKGRDDGLSIAVFVEKAAKEGDAEVCRKHYLKLVKHSPLFPGGDVVLSERDDMALAEYTVPEYQGVAINQKRLGAYMVREDVWITVQVSKREFKDEDQETFDKVLQSVRFKEFTPRRRGRQAPSEPAVTN